MRLFLCVFHASRHCIAAIAVSGAMLTGGPAQAQDAEPAQEDAPGWSAHGSVTLKGGSERHIGELDLFLPLWQDNDSLFYADLRAQTDDEGNQEGNAGFGYRQMGEDWVLGGYGFFDYRKSDETGNTFMQGTFGFEAMTEALDLRANVYIPESGEESASDAATVELVGSSLQIRDGVERGLPGVDGEAGYRLWTSQSGKSEVRAFAGGYYFAADGYETVAGPRGRIEARLFDIGFLGEGSRFTLGAEVTNDGVRDTQGFLVARLTIPFGGRRRSASGGLDRRMADYVVRDVDIVTGTAWTGESVAYLNTGVAVGDVSLMTGGDDIAGAAAGGGVGDLFLLDGSGGAFTSTESIVLTQGQVLLGGGSSVELVGLDSGKQATYTAPGSRPTVTADVTPPVGGGLAGGVVLSDDNMVIGLDIDNVSTVDFSVGILGRTITGAYLIDNAIATSGGVYANYGIYLWDAPESTVIDNIITTSGNRGVGLYLWGGSNFSTATGNDITTSGDFSEGLLVIASSNMTITDNIIETSGWNSNGLVVTGSSANNTITGNSITTSGISSDGMYVGWTSSSIFDSNIITTYGSQSYGIFLRDADSNTFNNNTIATSRADVPGFYLRDYDAGYDTINNTGTGNSYTGPAADCYVDVSVIWTNSIDLCP